MKYLTPLKKYYLKNIFKKHKSFNGFTLVEMLITVSILSILTAIILMSPSRGADVYKLQNASLEIVSQIDKTRSFSLSNKKYNAQSVPSGWGVHFNKNNTYFIIFADIDKGKDFDSNELSETIYFPQTISIDNLKVNSAPVDFIDIIFEPPNTKIYINGIEGNNAYITITNVNNNTKTINVNSVGGINY